MTEENVSKEICEVKHDIIDKSLCRLEKSMNDNFIELFAKVDAISDFKAVAVSAGAKADFTANLVEAHKQNHWKFISTVLAILTVISVLVAIVAVLLK